MPYDMKAAREAGVIPLGAAWAETSDVDSLTAQVPVIVFYSVGSFIQWIDSEVEVVTNL
jgi:hypothetical protein